MNKQQTELRGNAVKWATAPVRTQWGDGMMVADVAIDADSTLTLYCHEDDLRKLPQSVQLDASATDALDWELNVELLLQSCPHTIRCREGAGPEDLVASLCLTFARMEALCDAAPDLLEALQHILAGSLSLPRFAEEAARAAVARATA